MRRWGVALLCVFKPVWPVLAQNVIISPPQVPPVPPAVQQYQDEDPMQVFAPSEIITNGQAGTSVLQWGRFAIHPHLDYRFLYASGIESSPGHPQDTFVNRVTPGVLFNLGDHWILDYTPALTFYSNRQFQNTVEHSALLGWGTSYGDWFIEASQSYLLSSSTQVETASQTDQSTYGTAVNASYRFNDKASLDLGLLQKINDFGNGVGSTNLLLNLANFSTWSTLDWLNYQILPRLNVGVGAGVGYAIQDRSPNTLFEQYEGRINWRAADKISFRLSGGLQDQQYSSGGASDLATPIFDATIQYQPFEQTRLTLSASRTVNVSYFQDQVTEDIQITGGLNQRLLGKLYLDLSGGYDSAKYLLTVPAAPGLIGGRKDNYYFFNARLICPVLKRTTISVFCQYGDNSSSQSGFGYASTQGGFEIRYRY